MRQMSVIKISCLLSVIFYGVFQIYQMVDFGYDRWLHWGLALSDWYSMSPLSCVYAVGFKEYNLSCTHWGFTGIKDCTEKVCSHTPAGAVNPVQKMTITVREESIPDEFKFTVFANSSFGRIPLKKLQESYSCVRRFDYYGIYYKCDQQLILQWKNLCHRFYIYLLASFKICFPFSVIW